MFSRKGFARAFVCAAVCVVVSPQSLFAAQGAREEAAAAIAVLKSAAGGDVHVRLDERGVAAFVEAPAGRIMPIPGAPAAGARERAMAFVRGYARMFGLRNDADVVVTRVHERDQAGMEHVRMQQVVNGVPVTGSSLSVHLRGAGVVRAFSKTVPNADSIDTRPQLPEAGALHRASAVVEKSRKVKHAALSRPRLEILSKGLLDVRDQRPPMLAWFIEAKGPGVRELIWIDAKRGATLLHFSQLTHARNRLVYTALNTDELPGTLVRAEGAAATGNVDVDNAYDFTGDTYDYFLNEHGRDSYDGLGGALIATVDYCEADSPCPMPNAFWDGEQMAFGDGYTVDDITAHELTHAVTETSANLYYYMQSGALNESYSDIFGETVDLLNGAGSDDSADRWVVAEDLANGAIRHMMNPGLFGDPARMSDPNFFCDNNPQDDGGGVHHNSGVPNHAYALMVDGGTYNSFTIAGIGLTKAAKIQYRALTTYLDQASNFIDNYNALLSSCADLTGLYGISTADCAQVQKALDAVEMDEEWGCSVTTNVAPPLCSASGALDVAVFDLENVGSTAWVSTTVTGADAWGDGSGFSGIYWPVWPKSGSWSFWGYGYPLATESYVSMTTPIAVTADTRMQFAHTFSFDTFYDGGFIEYSTNGGGSWLDAGSLVSAGRGYTGPVPFRDAVRGAYTGDSYGYTATQLDLAPLAGQAVQFRFYITTDDVVDDYGWFVDDIRFYRCVAVPTNVVATAAGATSVNVTWTAAAGAASYRVYRSDDGTSFSLVGSPSSNSFTDTTAVANTAYLYKVRAFNGSESPDSNVDLATTVVFTDPALTTATRIKAVHFTELLTAVNAVRVLGGLTPVAFSAPAPGPGVSVRKLHLQGLRDGLHPALSALGRTLPSYTDPAITAAATGVKKVHIEQLRAGVQ
jgi:Zn-dependent metalloprotease